MTILFVSLVLLYIVIALTLDVFYFRKLRLWRAIFHSTLLFIVVSIIVGIVTFSTELSSSFFILFVFFSLVVSILGGIGNYFHQMFVDRRIKRLREKYSKLPDGPQKEQLQRFLDRIEGQRSKKRSVG